VGHVPGWQQREKGGSVAGIGVEAAVRNAATAFAAAAGVAVDISSCETVPATEGRTAVFVGMKVGEHVLRFGAGVAHDPEYAALDAAASAFNRSGWQAAAKPRRAA
jgi:2-isopropylmalate synthase